MFIIIVVVVVVAFLLTCLRQGQGSPHGLSSIHFQAHSYNDLREWRNLVEIRGVGNFKVDMHYTSICGTARKCFALSHDPPVPGVRYNTSDQLLEMLMDRSFKIPPSSSSSRITIQLCFKQGGDCTDSTWIGLLDSFYNKSKSLWPSVEFILDGTAKPIAPCLQQRWRPWKSVWIATDSPWTALRSWDASKGYDRFAILNNPDEIVLWEYFRDIDFGKFRNSTYPYMVWEPDRATRIRTYVNLYRSVKTNHEPGFTFVSNIDPIMLRLFANPHDNQVLIHDPHHIFGCPLVATLKSGLVIFVLPNKRDNSIEYATKSSGNAIPLDDSHNMSTNLVSVAHDLSSPNSLRIIDENGKVLSAAFDDRGALVATRISSLPTPKPKAKLLASNHGRSLWRIADTNQLVLIGCEHTQSMLGPSSGPPLYCDFATFNEPTNDTFITCSDQAKDVWTAFFGDRTWTKIGVGTKPRVYHARNHLILVKENGFCFHSETHNKRADVKMCDQDPTSTGQVMDVTAAPVSAWRENRSTVTPCTRNGFLHASFDLGHCPSMAITSHHAHLVYQSPKSRHERRTGCGVSAYVDSIVSTRIRLDSLLF